MKITKVRIDDIFPYEGNAKLHPHRVRAAQQKMQDDGIRPKILRRHNKALGDIDRQESRGARIDTRGEPSLLSGEGIRKDSLLFA